VTNEIGGLTARNRKRSIRTPPSFLTFKHFAATKSVTSRHAPLLDQAVLYDFITEGHFGRHLRRMREVDAERLSVLMESARQRLAGLLEISNVEAGLQTVGWLCDSIDAELAAKAAATRGVEVTPLRRYSREHKAQEGLQLGFAAVDRLKSGAASANSRLRWKRNQQPCSTESVEIFKRRGLMQKRITSGSTRCGGSKLEIWNRKGRLPVKNFIRQGIKVPVKLIKHASCKRLPPYVLYVVTVSVS